MLYVFGAYTLDTRRYELRCAGELVQLRAKVLDLLVYLVTYHGCLVSRQDLFEHVWSASFVSNATLDSCIKEARQAIGDTGRRQRVIQTRHGQGYRFIADVEEIADDVSFEPEEAPALPAGDDAIEQVQAPPLQPPVVLGVSAGTSSFEQELASFVFEPYKPASQAPPGEYKLATVLICVLAHTSVTIDALDVEARYMLQQRFFALAQQAVRSYGGDIQHVTDNGFMAFFGASVAHEDHAQRAVRAALTLQQSWRQHRAEMAFVSCREVAVHLGLHSGHIIAGRVGVHGEVHAVAVVDAVELADRLAHLAEPDTIVMSETTRYWVRGDVRVELLEPVTRRDSLDATPRYKVVGIAPPRSARQWQAGATLSPFVSREQEMAILHEQFEQAQHGQGRVLGIVGEPGMGKSRLLYELRRQVAQRPLTYLSGQCRSYAQGTPYLPLLDLFQRMWAITDEDSSQAKAAKIREGLRRVGMEAEAWMPYFCLLLGIPTDTERLNGLSPQMQRRHIFEALTQLMLRTSRRRLLILEIENLHWIDPTSEAWLVAFAERLGRLPILLLVTYRPGYAPRWMAKSYASQLILPRLTPHAGQQILAAILQGVPIQDALRQKIIQRARGNPFFLEELARSTRDNADRLHRAVPETIQAVLMARIDWLAPAAKCLLQEAAVVGPEAPLALLAAISTLPATTLHQSLAQLQAHEFLYETLTDADHLYTFKHVLTQEVAYQSLLRHTRQQIHRRIAQALRELHPGDVTAQPERLAFHYTEAGLSDQAVPYWVQAGELANARSAHDEAIAHLTTGLKVLATLPDTLERAHQELALLRVLSPTLMNTKGPRAAEVEHILMRERQLCQQVDDSPHLLPALLRAHRFYAQRAEHRTAREIAEQCLSRAQHGQDASMLMLAHHAVGITAHFLGEQTLARVHEEQALAFYNTDQHKALAMRGVHNSKVVCLGTLAAILWLLGYPDQALQRSQEAVTLAQTLEHPISVARAMTGMTILQVWRRDWSMAQQGAEALMQLADAQGLPAQLTYGKRLQAKALAAQGDLQKGIVLMRGCTRTEWTEQLDTRWPEQLAFLADAYECAGQIDAGLRLVAIALKAVNRTEERFYEAELYRLQGELLWHQPKQAENADSLPESYFLHALDIARNQQAKSLELRAATSLARLWQSQSKRQGAYELLEPVYGWFTEGFDTADLKEAKALLEELG